MANVEINLHTLRRVIRMIDELSAELKAIDTGQKPKKPKPEPEEPPKHTADIEEVLRYYRQIHPTKAKNVKPGHKSWEVIKKRLVNGHSARDCKLAILGNAQERWWCEKGLHGLTHIFEKDDNFDRFISVAQINPKKQEDKTKGYTGGSSEFSGGHTDFGD